MGKRTKDKVEEIVNDYGYILLNEYVGKHNKTVFIQDEWGYKYNVRLEHLIQGTIPCFVAKGNLKTLENIVTWLKLEEKTFELCEENEYKGSSKKLWFHCLVPECDMNFDTSWHDVYSKNYGCSFCSGKRVSDKNRLSVVRPDISKEWDDNLNEDTPDDVSFGSNKSRFWICPKGHPSYPSIISSRTSAGNGCPICANEQTESIVATELKQWCKTTFKYVDIEHRMFKNPETGWLLRCNIYIGEPKNTNGVYIEVHGEQHYQFNPYYHKTIENFENCKNRDKIKKKYAKKNGIYIEIDLRKIKTTEEAINYVIKKINIL